MDPKDAWRQCDRWLERRLGTGDPLLEAALAASDAAGLPAISVSPLQGAMLMLFARMQAARAILEVGTLAGYSTIWLARGMAEGGRVVTLELEPRHAEVARANFVDAGLADRIEVMVGPAAESLAKLRAARAGPFDLVFIDADKASSALYLEGALAMSRPGTLVVIDNVVRGGAVADDGRSGDPTVAGVRRVLDAMAADARLECTAIQTVGSKGYDGFAMARVR